MNDASEPLIDLVEAARHERVVVVGGGIAGLVAALEFAKVGILVTVLEASDRLGGVAQGAEVGGVHVDLGPEGYSTKGGAVRALVDELGLGNAVASPDADAVWLAGPAGVVRQPAENVLGIPENPWDESVRRIIGWSGTWRAYLDRVRPPLTIGQQRSLGHLVRTRMGDRVLDRLVAPASLGAFAIHPDDVDVSVVAPGLSAALTRTGSLSGAVAQVRGARAAERSGAPFEGIEGGMPRLVAALAQRLRELGARIETGSPVTSLERLPDGRWEVQVDSSDDERVVDAADLAAADIVVVATPEADARRLLAPHASGIALDSERQTLLETITLVLASPELADAPRRTVVYPLPGASRAAIVTDLTAKWAWLRAAAGDGVQVVRLSFGGPGGMPATAALDDSEAAELAVAEASTLLGVALSPADLRGFRRDRYSQPRPGSALGQPEDAAAVRADIAAVNGLVAVGAWLAGTGLAQVVPDATAEADRVRRSALWGQATSAADQLRDE
ncbi:protoporphyrinogen/coproporphyrinogen oxidase [Microbacterium lacus]|uniref:protoporphyrinogen/coproporphyrinogen oxidase n=1 Tax=Microbacterium lacus TaxID=415217 RepID=UPI00384A4ED8